MKGQFAASVGLKFGHAVLFSFWLFLEQKSYFGAGQKLIATTKNDSICILFKIAVNVGLESDYTVSLVMQQETSVLVT